MMTAETDIDVTNTFVNCPHLNVLYHMFCTVLITNLTEMGTETKDVYIRARNRRK